MKKITVFLILSLLAFPAIAEDVAPWPDRDPILTPTFEWDFMDENWSSNGFPDGVSGINNFPNGTPYLEIWGSDTTYYPSIGPGPGGAILASAEVVCYIPVTTDAVEARVQITYDTNYGCPEFVYFYSDYASGGIIYEEIIPLENSSWAVKVIDVWGYTYDGGTEANLFFRGNSIFGATPIISEIVVDMIPEPSTMLLFAFGGLMMRKR